MNIVAEEDIIELEKRYWQLQANSHSGKMDVATLGPLISPPLPDTIIQGFFDAFDENRDGHIDFKEMACGISAAARGPLTERQKCRDSRYRCTLRYNFSNTILNLTCILQFVSKSLTKIKTDYSLLQNRGIWFLL